MNGLDTRTLCAALGFTAVLLQGDRIPEGERAGRAADLVRTDRGILPDACGQRGQGDHGNTGGSFR